MKAVWMAALLLSPVTLLAGGEKTVFVIEIREEITHNTLFLVRRGVNEAAADARFLWHSEQLVHTGSVVPGWDNGTSPPDGNRHAADLPVPEPDGWRARRPARDDAQ